MRREDNHECLRHKNLYGDGHATYEHIKKEYLMPTIHFFIQEELSIPTD
jgi:hypothetical protein